MLVDNGLDDRHPAGTICGPLVAQLAAPATAAGSFPGVIALPDGWGAEGIATGRGATAYAGSLATGAIYRADLRGSIRRPGRPAKSSPTGN